ncbi:MAG TPA: hypothetical protein VMR34_03090 [Candidatus Saccharimonadales bacterium]|nr:hypothetical protein [Candidatus Saccharimonadales bacterium]
MQYADNLEPDHEETYEMYGIKYKVPGVALKLKKWEGPSIANTFGGKPLVNYEDEPMFAELAIQKMAVAGGWSARWVETYASRGGSPYYFTDWLDAPLSKQVVVPLEGLLQQDLMSKVWEKNNQSFSGCWDVLAWDKSNSLFLESKRYKKDSIRGTQMHWLKAGLAAGLKPGNFLIVQWDF